MWKIKLDDNDDVWLAEVGTTTTKEDDAWLLPDIPSAQAQLEKVRRYMPYPNAMVVAQFDDGP